MSAGTHKNSVDSSTDFLTGDGEMARLMRSNDWSQTTLGDPATWPQALRTAVRLLLNSGHPMYIWWGPQGACLYNDAYRQSIGPERHPSSLGRPAREVWEEIWHIIGWQVDQVMSGGKATWHENALVPITRNGRREDVYWTYSYSPIDDATAANGVGGVLVVCTETTQSVLGGVLSPRALWTPHVTAWRVKQRHSAAKIVAVSDREKRKRTAALGRTLVGMK
jgi:hypothetical protein